LWVIILVIIIGVGVLVFVINLRNNDVRLNEPIPLPIEPEEESYDCGTLRLICERADLSCGLLSANCDHDLATSPWAFLFYPDSCTRADVACEHRDDACLRHAAECQSIPT
jgi:hypothetical protein